MLNDAGLKESKTLFNNANLKSRVFKQSLSMTQYILLLLNFVLHQIDFYSYPTAVNVQPVCLTAQVA
jgi:hypothetical protein